MNSILHEKYMNSDEYNNHRITPMSIKIIKLHLTS